MRRGTGAAAVLIALFAASLTLRPQLVGIGPLLPEVQDDLGVSHAVAGLLGTIPVLCMGLFAPLAPFLAVRVGARNAVSAAIALIGVFGLVRAGVPGAALVVLLTVPIGIGMGLGNALMVVAVKERFAHRPLLVTAIYAMGIQLASAVAAGVAVPLSDAGGGWRAPLAVFGAAALACLGIWLLPAREPRPSRVDARPPRLPWRSGTVWLIAVLFMLNTILFYGFVQWLPDAFTEQGWSESRAGYLVAVLNVATLAGTLLVAFGGERVGGSRRQYMLAAVVMLIAGTLLLKLHPDGGWAWAALTGAGIGTLFPLSLTLPLDVADRPADVGAVAGLMLGAGYGLAAVAPFALGGIRDLTGSFSASLWTLVAVAVAMVPVALACSPARLHRGVREPS